MEGFIKFFGTGGARFVVSSQIRATGGLWLRYRNTNLYIDPGPGSVVRIRSSKEIFNPGELDGIIITHKHIDHANDVNVMIEAMTEGGFNRKGTLFCPGDALGDDPAILRHARQYPEKIEVLREQGKYGVKDIVFTTPVRHKHPVETYGLVFHFPKTIGLISDTRYVEGIEKYYRTDCLIVNVLRTRPIEDHDPVDHLALSDFVRIVREIRPEVAIMTHFGMKMIQEKPHLLVKALRKETGVHVIAARDGMKFEF